MKILRILLSTIFACIFAITVLVTAILGVFNEIFSQDYIMTKIEESGIYEENLHISFLLRPCRRWCRSKSPFCHSEENEHRVFTD